MSNDILPVVDAWTALRNGDLGMADTLIAPDIRVHTTLTDGHDGNSITDAAGLVGWVRRLRGALDLDFEIEVGPIAQNDLLALRWRATGGPADARVDFTGIDMLRVDAGQIAEAWLDSDLPPSAGTMTSGSLR